MNRYKHLQLIFNLLINSVLYGLGLELALLDKEVTVVLGVYFISSQIATNKYIEYS